MSSLRPILALAGALIFFVGCKPSQATEDSGLFRSLLSARRVSIAVPSELREAAEHAAASIRAEHGARGSRGLRVEVVGLEALADEDGREGGPWIIVGGLEHEATRSVFEAAGITPLDGAAAGGPAGFHFDGHDYRNSADAVVVTLEDPLHPGLPMTLWQGGSVERLVGYMDRLDLAWRPSFTTWKAGWVERRGRLSLAGRVERATVVDFTQLRKDLRAGSSMVRVEGFELVAPQTLQPALLDAYVRDLVEARAWVADWALDVGVGGVGVGEVGAGGGAVEDLPRVRVVLHEVPRLMQMLLGRFSLFEPSPLPREVHALLGARLPNDGGQGMAGELLVELLGPPAEPWLLEGASVAAANSWWGRDLDEWIAHLFEGGLVPTADELIDAAADTRMSDHLRGPARAALVQMLRKERGDAYLRALWKGEEALQADAEVGAAMGAWLEANSLVHGEAIRTRREARHESALSASFLRGLNLTRGQTPFTTRRAAESLDEAVDGVGADAFSLPVFGFVEADIDDVAGLPRRVGLAASESDAELLTYTRYAQERGARMLLRPHVLSSPSGQLYGELHAFTTAEHWLVFFRRFRPFAIHYALLAELLDCEYYCFASGISKAARTGAEPDHTETDRAFEAGKLNAWRLLLADLRGAFHGGLTYAASWTGTQHRVEFWDELDFVGVEAFNPLFLPEGDQMPTRPAFEEALDELLVTIRRFGKVVSKPALILDAGFPSTDLAWRRPWVPSGKTNPARQAELLELLGEAILRHRALVPEGKPQVVRGLFLSGWSTDLGDGGMRDRGYTLHLKPGAERVEALFAEL